ncbi:hypothetical protein RFI_31894 [Reticulomyxa filosa]|uniref:Uncharacterized protein n=1 Tax=Reticulomyxa filosa TaxID=46433 RepID=X6LVW3_RETFI|nr:hypothetical protein RFI_31894 [Reticulomyxa filosa]|eukprot:ETO05501.1 hypothetical protein RFI_31894 [Reticulomyxa filosa]
MEGKKLRSNFVFSLGKKGMQLLDKTLLIESKNEMINSSQNWNLFYLKFYYFDVIRYYKTLEIICFEYNKYFKTGSVKIKLNFFFINCFGALNKLDRFDKLIIYIIIFHFHLQYIFINLVRLEICDVSNSSMIYVFLLKKIIRILVEIYSSDFSLIKIIIS